MKLSAALLLVSLSALAQIPTPESVLGHKPGDDFYLASYAESLDDAGARIGLVYTRPELRGRGYGTAITGSLAQLLLNEGQAWVCLFADNANPVSNGIYQRLGFQPELTYRTWLFDAGDYTAG